MTLERINVQQALDEGLNRVCTMAVNMRAGEALTLCVPGFEPIIIRFETRHGNGGRLRVHAPRRVTITPPEG